MASLRIKKGGCRPDQGDGCTGCERQNHIQRRHNLSRFGTTSFRHATSVLQFDLCKKRTRPESTWWHLVVARGGGARAEGAMQTPETPSAATTTVAVGNGDSAVTVTFEGEPMEVEPLQLPTHVGVQRSDVGACGAVRGVRVWVTGIQPY